MNQERIIARKRCPGMSQGLAVALSGLMMCMLVALPGCRYSDTLLEVITDPDKGVLEAHATPVFQEVEGAPISTELASVHLSENENFADQANFLPVYKEDAGINGQAVRRVHSEKTPDDTDASEGDEQDDNEEESSSTSEELVEEVEADALGEGESEEEEQTAEDGTGEQPDKTSGRGGTGVVYGEGEYEELPDTRCVAAKGQYALITQMLGGKGSVVAADAEWIAAMKAKGAFPNEGIEDIAAVWNADGKLDIEALIATPADAILVDGVDVILSEEETQRLQKEGFNIVHVPHLGETYTADKDIRTGVKVVGQILSGFKSQASYSTADMVEKYIQLHDSAINGCVNANGGYSYKMVNGTAYQTIYQGTSGLGEQTDKLSTNRITVACIDSWTSASSSTAIANRSYGMGGELYLDKETISLSEGLGLSACTVGTNFILCDYYLQIAGVVNNAYEDPKPTKFLENSQSSLPFAVIPGQPNDMTSRTLGNRETPSPLWYSQTNAYVSFNWITAGDKDFPGVITRDADMANKVARSAAKTNGLYNTGKPYKIYQIPSGIAGNWFDGNVESFMTSVWAHGVFQENNFSGAQEWVESFYRLFYRIDSGAMGKVDGFSTVLTASCPTGN